MKAPTLAPAYCFIVPLLTAAAQRCGYALALHGSMTRDLDLVAVPWVAEAVGPEALVEALQAAVGFTSCRAVGPEDKPHGRLAWCIPLNGGAYIDLSVLQRGPTP